MRVCPTRIQPFPDGPPPRRAAFLQQRCIPLLSRFNRGPAGVAKWPGSPAVGKRHVEHEHGPAGADEHSPGVESQRHRVPQLVLIAISAVLLIFVLYELVERTWLQGEAMERLHLFHRIRGLLAAIVAATVTGWLILRRSPPLFAASDPADGFVRGSARTEEERVAHYAHWFIRMRWLAVVVATALVFFAVRVVELLPQASWRPLLATIAVLAGMNVAYGALLRAGMPTRRVIPLQAYGDLLVLTVLLHYSGGVENALATLMLFHVIIAGIVLPRRDCYLVATAASMLFAVLVWAEWARVIEHYTLRVFPHSGSPMLTHAAHDANYALSGVAVQTAILFLTAYFATTVTDRLRRHERQLEVYAGRILAQSQLLERALDMTGTALCVCDRELKSTWRNRRWQTWFAGAGGDCGGLRAPEASIPARKTLEDGQVRVTEVCVSGTRDGDVNGPPTQRIFQVTTAPLVDLEASTTHVVQLGREITQQKQIQAGMVRAEKLAAVGELAGKIAHEVNNPIAIISAKVRLLLQDEREQFSARTVEELRKITELTDRVARIAQGLLSYCRPSAGPMAPLDIRDPIRKALAIIEPPATAAGVRTQERLADEVPEIRANASEMVQVFLNLFLNALDAMPGGGTLSVTARVDGGPGSEPGRFVEVLVEDTGCGVPEEIRDRVFEPFVTSKADGRGTGLGLSICLGLVRSNGGEIDLDSEPGRGTRVRIRMPAPDTTAGVAADG